MKEARGRSVKGFACFYPSLLNPPLARYYETQQDNVYHDCRLSKRRVLLKENSHEDALHTAESVVSVLAGRCVDGSPGGALCVEARPPLPFHHENDNMLLTESVKESRFFR